MTARADKLSIENILAVLRRCGSRAEAHQFLDELKGPLLRETAQEPDEGNLVGKAEPIMRVAALPKLQEIFLGQVAARLSWLRENIARMILRPRAFGYSEESKRASPQESQELNTPSKPRLSAMECGIRALILGIHTQIPLPTHHPSAAPGPQGQVRLRGKQGRRQCLGLQHRSNGALTPVPGSPFAAGSGPVSVAVDPTGKFAYVANVDGSNVSAYSIGANGALTPVPGSPFAARVNPISVATTRLMPLQSPHETENTAR